MPSRKKVTVTVALDVEEEGLFSGRYERRFPSLRNIPYLVSLTPLLERGVKPTLFCAWPVFHDSGARKVLDGLRAKFTVEIGCHLHYWNTPPLVEGPDPELEPVYHEVATARLNPVIINAKLEELTGRANDFNSAPTSSFRMGRWDLHRIQWPLLMNCGIKCEASVRPLHAGRQADKPDHFAAPQDPYRLVNAQGSIFEIPLTVVSYIPGIEALKQNAFFASVIKRDFRHWGALPLLAVEYPLSILKLVTLMHLHKGGRNLSLTWHSSEMMPGGVPHMPDRKHVDHFLKKMEAYLDWLETRFDVEYETMDGLRQRLERTAPVIANREGDWCFPAEELFSMTGQDLKIQ